jgi:hypothetical protein
MPDEPAHKRGNFSGQKLPNGTVANVQTIALDRPTTPGHPFKVRARIKNKATLQIVEVMHERQKNQWASIKVTVANSPSTPPSFFGA